MKTRELLVTPETQLTPKLKLMKLKELERHAQKILAGLGQSNYDLVMNHIIKLIPTLDGENQFALVQQAIAELLPTASNESAQDKDAITRLTVIVMMVVSKKFNDILNSK